MRKTTNKFRFNLMKFSWRAESDFACNRNTIKCWDKSCLDIVILFFIASYNVFVNISINNKLLIDFIDCSPFHSCWHRITCNPYINSATLHRKIVIMLPLFEMQTFRSVCEIPNPILSQSEMFLIDLDGVFSEVFGEVLLMYVPK